MNTGYIYLMIIAISGGFTEAYLPPDVWVAAPQFLALGGMVHPMVRGEA